MQGEIGHKLEAVVEDLNQQEWLAPAEEPIQNAVLSIYESSSITRKIENFLHGVWLGHPLHPVLITVPLGSWTMTLILDLFEEITGKKHYRGAADVALNTGIFGAIASAVTGITDWARIGESPARRSGLMHATLNSVGLLLYIASSLLRRQEHRGAARNLSLLGYVFSMAAGYIGGDMVYRQRIGVDHAPKEGLPEDYSAVLADADLPEGEMRQVSVDGVQIILARVDGEVFALANTCSHLGGPLAEGELDTEACSVTCPWHGSRFALEDGHVLDGPATYSQPALDARVMNGQIEVRFISNS